MKKKHSLLLCTSIFVGICGDVISQESPTAKDTKVRSKQIEPEDIDRLENELARQTTVSGRLKVAIANEKVKIAYDMQDNQFLKQFAHERNTFKMRMKSNMLDRMLLGKLQKKLEAFGESLSLKEAFTLFDVKLVSKELLKKNVKADISNIQYYALLCDLELDRLLHKQKDRFASPDKFYAKDATLSRPSEDAIKLYNGLSKLVAAKDKTGEFQKKENDEISSRICDSMVLAEGEASVLGKEYTLFYLVTRMTQKVGGVKRGFGRIVVLERPIDAAKWTISDDLHFSLFLEKLKPFLPDVRTTKTQPLDEEMREPLKNKEFKTIIYPRISPLLQLDK